MPFENSSFENIRRAPALVVLLALALVVAACNGAGPVVPPGAEPGSCLAPKQPPGLVAVGADGQSSSLALGKFDAGPLKGKLLAFIADEDAQSVFVVDVDERKQIAAAKLGSRLGQLMILPDGRIAVALRGSSQLTVLHPRPDGTLTAGCMVSSSAEPIALALAGETLLVSAGWGARVDAFSAADFSKKASIEVAREPRQIAVSDDRSRAYVTHAVGGKLTVLDLERLKVEVPIDLLTNPTEAPDAAGPEIFVDKIAAAVAPKDKGQPGKGFVRIGAQGFAIVKTKRPAGRVLVPQVLVDPGDPESRPQVIGMNSVPAYPNVGVVDAGTKRLVNVAAQLGPSQLMMLEDGRRFNSFGQEEPFTDCLLPRAAVLDDASSTLLVTCFGVDAVIGYDAASAEPSAVEKVRWNVASGPSGIALDPDKRRAIVFAQFERVLEIVKLDEIGAIPRNVRDVEHDRIELPPLGGTSLPILLGRQIFFSTGDARISVNGLACASCHPEGRDDGITWATPDGPRRTLSIASKLAAPAPFGWDGESKDVDAWLTREFKRLRGQGLRNVQRDALMKYIDSIAPPPADGKPVLDAALVERGKALFSSPKTQCATCHVGGETDKKTHDVGSMTSWDRKPTFDTPSLRNVSSRAPFFHDGRFATLKDLLLAPHGEEGKEAIEAPAEADVEALEAYLRSL